MKLKVILLDKEYNFKRYSKYQDFLDIFCSIEPQFELDSFTYYDEEQDLITISKEEDYNCFLVSSISTIQAKVTSREEFKANLRLQTGQEIIQLMQLTHMISQQKMFYEHNLQITRAIQKVPIEEQPLQQEKNIILRKIEEQKKRIEKNKKLKLKTDLVYHFLSSDICSIVNQVDRKLRYDQTTQEEFDKQLESTQKYLVDQFFQVYLQRLNKIIEIRETQQNGNRKMTELKNNLKQIEYQIKRTNKELKLRENYFLQGIYAIKCLVKKL
ncbi:unnamed protein product (macronuclear) [Paramecium tetraurelia]|uniref:PB1 domain-containing protein n=1 Tax=Paramecium tetraurelia TaxID=5888 RepID=A0DP45_PARTE|nr:uncharacterized protein GSPATT00018993001 [Paramecium tetraurelia]CAK84812.1 unnamed protein product [Paramecium tetraurelia]|eukprot:XP_001452209.1 hypothetical protein (macronuclear) [Paramecium tetraurelia strain d4-2]